jgi:hypothetical protein
MLQSSFLHLAWIFSAMHMYMDTAGREPVGPWFLEGRTSGGFILVIWGIHFVPVLTGFVSRKVRFDRSTVVVHNPFLLYLNREFLASVA